MAADRSSVGTPLTAAEPPPNGTVEASGNGRRSGTIFPALFAGAAAVGVISSLIADAIFPTLYNKHSRVPSTSYSPDEKEDTKNEKQISLLKDITSIIQSILTSLAIVAAGIWFFWTSETEPRILTDHEVQDTKLTDQFRWIRLKIKMKNEGKTRFDVGVVYASIDQVMPLIKSFSDHLNQVGNLTRKDADTIPWRYIKEAHFDSSIQLEPGESDYEYLDFVVPANVEIYQIYTCINEKSMFSWPIIEYSDKVVCRDRIWKQYTVHVVSPEKNR